MIRGLILISAALLLIVGIYLLKKEFVFLSLMSKGTSEENQQFLNKFGTFYLILAGIGFIVAFFNLKILSLIYILGLLVISAIFSVMLAKKIL